MKPKNRFLFASLITVAFASGVAHADTGTWTGGNGGTWNTTNTNWSGVSGTPWDITNGASNDAIVNNNVSVSGTVYANGINNTANGTFSNGVITLTGTSPFLSAASGITSLYNSSDVAGTSGFTKTGAGTVSLQGALKAITGGITSNQGTLRFDLGTATTGVVAASNTLTLGGGTLNVQGKNSGSSSQTLGNLTINTGLSTISLNPNGGTGTTLTLGNTWTKNAGGTLFLDLSSASLGTRNIASSPTLSNDIVGGYAIVRDATGTGFATVTGGDVVRYTGATTVSGNLVADTVATTNYRTTAVTNFNGPSATQTVNSVDIGSGFNLNSSSAKTLVIGTGGVVFTGASFSSLGTNLAVTSATGELNVFNTAGQTQIYGTVKDNGATSVSLVKSGTNVLFLRNVLNSYTGDTVINQGTIQGIEGVPNGVGKGNLVVNNGGTANLADAAAITINGLTNTTATGGSVTSSYGGAKTLSVGNANATASFNGVISGSGANALSITKIGTGTQTFSGTNTYIGATTVEGGKLLINGSISTSTTTVKTTGTLGGSGTVGVVTVESGGTLAPGNSPGILNAGNTTLLVGSFLDIEIDGATVGTGYDQLNVTGTVSLAGALAVTMGYTPVNDTLFFILANDGSDPISGTFSNASVDGNTYTLGGQVFKISYFGNQTSPGVGTFTGGNDVVLMAIPEPSAALLGGIGFLLLLRRRRIS